MQLPFTLVKKVEQSQRCGAGEVYLREAATHIGEFFRCIIALKAVVYPTKPNRIAVHHTNVTVGSKTYLNCDCRDGYAK